MNTGFGNSTTAAVNTLSFNAGATTTKLFVSVTGETGSSQAITATYNGTAMTLIPGSRSGRALGIYYLDAPFTGGAANIVVDASAITTVNGLYVAAASISGSALGFESVSAGAATSRILTNAAAGNFIMPTGAANTGTVNVDSPLVPFFQNVNSGSQINAAAYALNAPAGSQTYSYTTAENLGVASFAIPEPSSAALLGIFGGLALLRRRR